MKASELRMRPWQDVLQRLTNLEAREKTRDKKLDKILEHVREIEELLRDMAEQDDLEDEPEAT